MKIEINVLPDEQKEKLKEEKKIGFLLKMAFAFVAILLMVNVVLYLMQIVLAIEYKAAQKSSEAAVLKSFGKEIQLEKIFQETSIQVAKTSKISSAISNWARVLVRISELSPDGIRITNLSADGSQLKISGFSKTRDDFLNFQNKLREGGFQFSVNISNLVASNDFTFDLDLTVPQNYLIHE
jgi:Tfp pilus assembly protein PilN